MKRTKNTQGILVFITNNIYVRALLLRKNSIS